MTIQEGNKLIAEFMGAVEQPNGWVYLPHRGWGYSKKIYPANLRYNSNWDWIMPACKKFDSLDTGGLDRFGQSEYQNLSDNIDTKVTLYEILPVWSAIIEAITWYNTNNPKKKE